VIRPQADPGHPRQTGPKTPTARPSSYHDVVDEPLLRTIAAEIQVTIPGAEVRLFGSRARGTERPDSDLDLLFSTSEVQERRHGCQNVMAEAFRYGRRQDPAGLLPGPG
jgi:predicted nucleotidyltransferase